MAGDSLSRKELIDKARVRSKLVIRANLAAKKAKLTLAQQQEFRNYILLLNSMEVLSDNQLLEAASRFKVNWA